MAEFDCSSYRDEILRRFNEGTPMSPAARAHYIECVECIMAVSEQLDKNSSANGAAGADPAAAEAIRTAIERGRRVLEREFGIPTPRPVDSK